MMVLPPLFAPVPLYAETHYQFPFFFSILATDEPEIIADAPHRIEPGHPLPILLLCKDAHRYPTRVVSVHVDVRNADGHVASLELLHDPVMVEEPLWWTVAEVDVGTARGWLTCDVDITTERHGRRRTCRSDNHRTSSHAPLRVYRSAERLPGLPGMSWGEGHSHSRYTDDQVEFGVPLGAGRALARALGLGFVCVTDHSYDLDDRLDDYLQNDPALPKWQEFHREALALNGPGTGPVIVRGEEVTVRNGRGRNVHCLVLGDRQFHPGSGDSAERWLRTRSELGLEELALRADREAFVCAAHPREPVPFIQRLLLGRDVWHDDDAARPGVQGLQFWNGDRGAGFVDGRRMWVRQLLAGRRTVTHAGNDAHGNFNRFRQIGVPFVRIREADHQLFGRVRTGVWSDSPFEPSIVKALRTGRSCVSDGPALAICSDASPCIMGTVLDRDARPEVRAASSAEYGRLSLVRILAGTPSASGETLVAEWVPEEPWSFTRTIPDIPNDAMYIRSEATTEGALIDGGDHLAMTNPVWSA